MSREGLDYHLAELRIALVCASGEALPFRPGSFDRAVFRVALPYLDARRALAQARRALRRAGFEDVTLARGRHFVATAQAAAPPG